MALRPRMWVVDEDGRVGLLARPTVNGQPPASTPLEFHVVNDAGKTRLILPAASVKLVQARFDEIPEPRRPDRLTARRYGYV